MFDTLEKAIEYGVRNRGEAVMEKDGRYNVALTWPEFDYATAEGWHWVGHPATLSGWKAGA